MKGFNVLVALLFILILGMSASCEVMRFRECNRIHPFWYCLGDK
jgi:hypothetical protein